MFNIAVISDTSTKSPSYFRQKKVFNKCITGNHVKGDIYV